MDSSSSTSASPRWLFPWLSLLAPLYPISILAIVNLRQLKLLPAPARWLLTLYALSQQIPALLTPDPLLSSGLALIRTVLLLAMIGVGVSLTRSEHIRPLGIGLTIVMLTGLIFSGQNSWDILSGRLSHPYMTNNTVGIAGTLGLFIALFVSGKTKVEQWGRWTLGGLSALTLLLTGSRGALAAAVLGVVVGLLLQGSRQRVFAALCGIALLGGGAVLGERTGIVALTRLSTADTTGRDLVWANTLSVVQAYPWGGVGTFQLGRQLMPGECKLFEAVDGSYQPCPEWLALLGQPWIIAHNLTLHQLAETGPLGTLGLLSLVLVGLLVAFWRRDALAGAVFSGMLMASVNDNTLLVPSPFFAEAFWILIGVQLRFLLQLPSRPFEWGIILAPVLAVGVSLPILGQWRQSVSQPTKTQLAFLSAPLLSNTEAYTAYARVVAQPGPYRLTLRSCQVTCTTVDSKFIWVDDSGSPLTTLHGRLRNGSQTLTLALLSRAGGIQYRPLAQQTWTVQVKGQP